MPESQQKKRQRKRIEQREPIQPLNEAQARYLHLLEDHDCVAGIGPAGTGKTFLACLHAATLLAKRRTDKILLTRPTIGVANRTLGFLPGRIEQKMAPWARPLVDAFKRILGSGQVDTLLANKTIEVGALEHMRGLTFDDAVMIIDEAQNASALELKAFLTRIGARSRVVVCGDLSQSDLTSANGLSIVVDAIKRGLVREAELMEFLPEDVVRSELCAQWAHAFDVLAPPATDEGGVRGTQFRGSAVMP